MRYTVLSAWYFMNNSSIGCSIPYIVKNRTVDFRFHACFVQEKCSTSVEISKQAPLCTKKALVTIRIWFFFFCKISKETWKICLQFLKKFFFSETYQVKKFRDSFYLPFQWKRISKAFYRRGNEIQQAWMAFSNNKTNKTENYSVSKRQQKLQEAT